MMDTSPPSAESTVTALGDADREEAAGERCLEEVDSSVTMIVPSSDIKKPHHHHHHQRNCSPAITSNSDMMLHEGETEIGGRKVGAVDVNENHYSGHKEGIACRRKTTCVSPGTVSLGMSHFEEDISRFNTSNRNGPNLATFYMKHNDTDSDQDVSRGHVDVAESGRLADTKSVEDSSDDEWTYKQGSESPIRMNGITDGSGSSSETASSVRRHSVTKKSSVVMRLDFGSGPDNAVNNNNVDREVVLNGKHDSNNRVDDEQKELTGSPGRLYGRNSLETIHRLVSQAEEMVREDASPDKMAAGERAARLFEPLVFSNAGKMSANSQAKYGRIKQWLRLHLQDQADAKSLLQVSPSHFLISLN